MPSSHDLQITRTKDATPLTPAQKRFNTLIRQIEKARGTLAAWRESIPAYRDAYARVMLPLEKQLFDADRNWLSALDAALAQEGWTGTERRTLRGLLCERAGELLQAREGDEEIKALFNKYADVDYDTGRREAALRFKEMHEALTGMDLGDDETIRNGEDVLERMRQNAQQQDAAAQATYETRASSRKKTAAHKRRQAQEQQAAQSLREIYRKLASALHPDREPDARQRATKTALMQRVNQAYEANDLLALLELQLQVEQIDTDHMAGASTARLKRYNKVLEEQLAELQTEIQRMDAAWRMEFDVQVEAEVNPLNLHGTLEGAERLLRAEIASVQRDLQMLADAPAAKRWLKKRRVRVGEQQRGFDLRY